MIGDPTRHHTTGNQHVTIRSLEGEIREIDLGTHDRMSTILKLPGRSVG